MIWIRYCGSSAARSSQSRIAGHPVRLSNINITEFCRLSIEKLTLRPAKGPHNNKLTESMGSRNLYIKCTERPEKTNIISMRSAAIIEERQHDQTFHAMQASLHSCKVYNIRFKKLLEKVTLFFLPRCTFQADKSVYLTRRRHSSFICNSRGLVPESRARKSVSRRLNLLASSIMGK
jgi:hypothetical protein